MKIQVKKGVIFAGGKKIDTFQGASDVEIVEIVMRINAHEALLAAMMDLSKWIHSLPLGMHGASAANDLISKGLAAMLVPEDAITWNPPGLFARLKG